MIIGFIATSMVSLSKPRCRWISPRPARGPSRTGTGKRSHISGRTAGSPLVACGVARLIGHLNDLLGGGHQKMGFSLGFEFGRIGAC